MLKICHITSVHPRYDIRIFVKECVTLAKAGHEVSLIVADDGDAEIKDGVHIYSVGKAATRRARMRQTPKLIYQKIMELKPDVVHFHDPELILTGLKLTRQKIKVVYDVHEDLPKQIMSKYWLPSIFRPVLSTSLAKLEKYAAKKFYGIITATPIIENRFKEYNPNTICICNYPLLAELNVVDSNWSNRLNQLCYIGSISKTRGVEAIVRSLSFSQLPLELAGPFSGDINLDALKQIQGGEYINYHGILNRAEISALLQQVKIGLVTLLPTPSYMESLPIKMFEYMLAGIPVIASNFPLWESIIINYNCGILVNPYDSGAIARACKKLLDDEALAKQMGENGRQAVLKSFNWEQESRKLLKFYAAESN